jgi:hypothetical protein
VKPNVAWADKKVNDVKFADDNGASDVLNRPSMLKVSIDTGTILIDKMTKEAAPMLNIADKDLPLSTREKALIAKEEAERNAAIVTNLACEENPSIQEPWMVLLTHYLNHTGRMTSSPLDISNARKAVELADGDVELCIEAIDKVMERKPPVKSFAYFLSAIKEAVIRKRQADEYSVVDGNPPVELAEDVPAETSIDAYSMLDLEREMLENKLHIIQGLIDVHDILRVRFGETKANTIIQQIRPIIESEAV